MKGVDDKSNTVNGKMSVRDPGGADFVAGNTPTEGSEKL